MDNGESAWNQKKCIDCDLLQGQLENLKQEYAELERTVEVYARIIKKYEEQYMNES